jgi:hypothetical protein
VCSLPVADGNRLEQLAALSFELNGLLRTLSEDCELELAESPLHAQQQPVVRKTRIINAILVDNETADKGTELKQCMPVPPVAGKSRSFDRQHCANPTLTDRHQQPLKAWSTDAGTRYPKIVINQHNVGPSQLPSAVGETVLPSPTFLVAMNLIGSRLTDVDIRRTGEMIWRNLIHHRAPHRL